MAFRASDQSDGDDLEENHEINVTPFIDVILVLLIIFMVAAPLATVDVNVDLPASTAVPRPRPERPLYLTIMGDLTVKVGEDTVARPALGTAIDRFTDFDREQRIFLRADRAIAYGELMQVIDLLRAAGYLKVALVGLETGAAAAVGSAADGGALAAE